MQIDTDERSNAVKNTPLAQQKEKKPCKSVS